MVINLCVVLSSYSTNHRITHKLMHKAMSLQRASIIFDLRTTFISTQIYL